MESLEQANKPEKPKLTVEQIRSHIESSEISWVSAEDLLKETQETCVDGRREKGAIGTPGGNAGEFILALTAAEASSGQSINLEDMENILERYLEVNGKFYMHTDSHTLEKAQIKKEMLGEELSDEEKKRIIESLVLPENTGCGHIKLMMENPEQYGVRPELVKKALEAIFSKSLSGDDRIVIEVLEGEHTEGAVVKILIDGEVKKTTEIPSVPPNLAGEEMFVYHPQVAEFLRGEITKDMSYISGIPIFSQTFMPKITELAEKQLTATLERLAEDLPVYNAVFDPVGKKLIRVEPL